MTPTPPDHAVTPPAGPIRSDAQVALTLGDPAGIGPEIAVKALSNPEFQGNRRPLVIGPCWAFEKALWESGRSLAWRCVSEAEVIHGADGDDPDTVSVVEPVGVSPWRPLAPGTVCAEGGAAAYHSLALAIRLAMRGRVDAICTAPLHKKALQLAGFPYPGHTEILAALSETPQVVMMLEGGGLRVALTTIHCPLRAVADQITRDRVLEVARLTAASLQRDWGIDHPRVAITGLNPHAGDSGALGDEEERHIAPAIADLRAEGVDASGPWPADSVFFKMMQDQFDVIVAMYHDQGLAALKAMAFDKGVNITLGLPFIRTSVDHGTAMDIAGAGLADPGSLNQALRAAFTLAARRRATAFS